MLVSTAGQVHVADMFTGPVGLDEHGMWELAAVVLFTTVAAPALKIACMLYVLIGLRLPDPPRHIRMVFAWVQHLRPWSMIEVYLLGVFVAYVRLSSIVFIEIGIALYALGALLLTMIAADVQLDAQFVWEEMERLGIPNRRVDHAAVAATSEQDGVIGCDTCGLVSRVADAHARCPRCGFRLRQRKPNSVDAHLGARHRGRASLCAGQCLSGAYGGAAWLGPAQHHPRRCTRIAGCGGLAARGAGVLRLDHGADAEAGRPDNSADQHSCAAARSPARPHGAVSHHRLHRPLVDDRHLHGVDPGGTGAVRRDRDDRSGVWRNRVCRGGDPDDVRRADVRSAADVGCGASADGMSDAHDPHPTASVGPRHSGWRRISLIWIIPIVTAAIGAWLAWDTLSQRGPLITITFQTAEGLQAGQSHVRYKAVDMGLVEGIALTYDRQRVAVKVRMTRAAEPLLQKDTEFWVVKPRFFAGSISGLETLFSGAYIGMLPSRQNGEEVRDFTGLEDPPVLQSDEPGHTFLLRAPSIGNLNLGSPVYYRDLTVGEVLGWDIGDMADYVTVHAFVRAPFDKYVHDGSRFWNASGATVSLGANGLQLQLELLRALVLGRHRVRYVDRRARHSGQRREPRVSAVRQQGRGGRGIVPAAYTNDRVFWWVRRRAWRLARQWCCEASASVKCRTSTWNMIRRPTT